MQGGIDDGELAQIRSKRLAELRGNAPSSIEHSSQSLDQQRNDESQKEEMRHAMISQILDTEARERLNRISIVKPEKARAVEELIIRMWRTGQLGSRRVGESQFIDLLEQISGSTDGGSAPKVVFQRRRFDDESDDEEYTF